MYAIVETGGKQFRVEPGEKIRVERLPTPVGENVQFENVLLVVNETETLIGTPHVENMPVFAKVLDHGRGEKIKVVKMKRRKNYRRTQGHRQNYTELEILSIGEEPQTELPAEVPEEAPEATSDSD